jgi:uncharacterized membrane protein YdcZ (DUF606 family)
MLLANVVYLPAAGFRLADLFAALEEAPAWMFFGGCCWAMYVNISITLPEKIGVALFFVCSVAGHLTSSLLYGGYWAGT